MRGPRVPHRRTRLDGPPRSAGRTIARRTARQLRIGAVVVGLACGLSVYATASAYRTQYPTAAARAEAAAAVGSDSGLRILLGPINDIATIGGYTVYKNFAFLGLLLAIWSVLAGTRVLRGEEDAGRWQLQLAGATTPTRATAATVAGLGVAVAVVGALTSLLVLVATRDPTLELTGRGSLLYAGTLVAVPAVFAAVGALTSQLAATRRAATTLGLSVVAVAFVLRMAGDAGPQTAWVAWLTPFGWLERVRPYTRDDALGLVVAAVAVAVLVVAAVVLSGRRDVGSGLLAARDTRHERTTGLGSALGLTVRLEGVTLASWVLGTLLTGFVLGVFSDVATQNLPADFRTTLERFGLRGAFLDQFLGIAFLLVVTVAALLPAGQVGSAAQEEQSRRLVHVLSAPVSRRTWLAGRLGVTAAAVVLAALLGGVGVVLGAASRGMSLDLGTMLGAALNGVPTALVALGIGALAISLAPRFAAVVVYAVVVWSVFADLLAPLTGGFEWLQRLSLFDTMALLPGERADATTLVVTTVVGLALCAAGVEVFARRDLRTD